MNGEKAGALDFGREFWLSKFSVFSMERDAVDTFCTFAARSKINGFRLSPGEGDSKDCENR